MIYMNLHNIVHKSLRCVENAYHGLDSGRILMVVFFYEEGQPQARK